MRLTKGKALAFLSLIARAAKALPTPAGPTYNVHPHNANFYIDAAGSPEGEHDDWRKRPFLPEASRFLSNHEAEIVKDHDLVVTPSLQTDVHFPNPLLPTQDVEIMKHYLAAVRAYEKSQRLTRDQKERALATKRTDIQRFNRMNICVHNWWFARECSGLRFNRILNFGGLSLKYNRLKEKLMEEMKVEGYVNLGRDLLQEIAKST